MSTKLAQNETQKHYRMTPGSSLCPRCDRSGCTSPSELPPLTVRDSNACVSSVTTELADRDICVETTVSASKIGLSMPTGDAFEAVSSGDVA